MNTATRWIIRGLALIVVLTGLYATHLFLKPISKIKASLSQAAVAEALTVDGEQFRDLNRNGQLDPYEDYRVDTESRVDDLLSQMTLQEKVGQMFHPPVLIEPDPLFRVFMESMNGGVSVEELITIEALTHFNFYGSASPENIASASINCSASQKQPVLVFRCRLAVTPCMKFPVAVESRLFLSMVYRSGPRNWGLPPLEIRRFSRSSDESQPPSIAP